MTVPAMVEAAETDVSNDKIAIRTSRLGTLRFPVVVISVSPDNRLPLVRETATFSARLQRTEEIQDRLLIGGRQMVEFVDDSVRFRRRILRQRGR